MDDKLVMFEDKMGKSLANLEEEFAGIRAGRANPHVLDKLRVDYYGTPSPIQSVANVSVPEPRMIQIQPWEASMVKEIEKAILSSDLGINPTNDGKLIRLVFRNLQRKDVRNWQRISRKRAKEPKLQSAIFVGMQWIILKKSVRQKIFPKMKSKILRIRFRNLQIRM